MLQGPDTASDPARPRDPDILMCPAPDYPTAPPDGPHTVSGTGISQLKLPLFLLLYYLLLHMGCAYVQCLWSLIFRITAQHHNKSL